MTVADADADAHKAHPIAQAAKIVDAVAQAVTVADPLVQTHAHVHAINHVNV